MAAIGKEVAILLATYNGEKFLEVQLESLINQTFKDFVCYVHDDGSQDRTVEILKEYQKTYPGIFQLLDYEGGHGAIGNFISLARYVRNNTKEPYIMFSDQDDYWYPTKIEKELEALKKYEDPSKPYLVYCDQEIVDGDLNIIAKSGMAYSRRKAGIDDSFKELVFENCAAGCTIAINRPCLDLAMDHVNEEHVIMHDWWFILVARCFGGIKYINEPLMKYRQHGTNTLGADHKVLSVKIVRYKKNLKKSLAGKARHVKKCEMQIIDISKTQKSLYDEEISKMLNALSRNKAYRMFFFCWHGYIKLQECFTLLFV